MPDVPMAIMTVSGAFAPLCSRRVFASVKWSRVGALLAPGTRPVTAVRRVLGTSAEAHFQRDHRVLNRAQWSSLDASRRLLDAFVPEGPVVMGIDETIERRRGERIAAQGICRDPVRASHAHFVKASGLRWVCLTVLASIGLGLRWAATLSFPFLMRLQLEVYWGLPLNHVKTPGGGSARRWPELPG
jgi:DDE superfamily endonuclease